MSQLCDQDYLRSEQYPDASRLNARIYLHTHFSVNPYDWFLWVFDQYDFSPQARILELGCGPGDLWRKNQARILASWEIILSDFSQGMLAQTRQNLADSGHAFRFTLIEAQSIPYPEATFDAVIANHMLYHVPDQAEALAEVRRVLRPGGVFYATTIGQDHLHELPELALGFDPDLPLQSFSEIDVFSLESGAAKLQPFFSQVTMRRYEDALHITQAEPLVDYILSGFRWGIDEQRRAEFLAYIQGRLEANGGLIRISKDSGMFIAS